MYNHSLKYQLHIIFHRKSIYIHIIHAYYALSQTLLDYICLYI